MKKTIKLKLSGFVFLIGILVFSCSNDFLQVNAGIKDIVQDTIFFNTASIDDTTIVFNYPKAGNAHWDIYQFPSWMEVNPISGNFQNGKLVLDVKIMNKIAIKQLGIFDLPLVVNIHGIGLVQYPLRYFNFGSPDVWLLPKALNLNYMLSGELSLENTGIGILFWKVIDFPKWLSVSKSGGTLFYTESEKIKVNVDTQNLAAGNYSGKITFLTNGPRKNISIEVSVNVIDPTFSGKVSEIEGEVIDAAFCKSTGLMVFATKNPNRIYYHRPDQSLSFFQTNKVPTAIDISEAGDQFVVASTNTELTVFDSEKMSEMKSVETGIVPAEVVWGNNGWAYVAPRNYTTNHLVSVNLNSGELIKHGEDLNGLTLLKKIPGKSSLIGEKAGWSPDFLFVFDISQGALSERFDQYNVNLFSFCMTENGDKIVASSRKVYKTPDYLGKGFIWETPVLAGELEGFNPITSIDHCAISNEFFVAVGTRIDGEDTRIVIYDDKGLSIKNELIVNECQYFDGENLIKMKAEVPYMYIDKSGKELVMIKKGTDYNYKEYWYFEKVEIGK